MNLKNFLGMGISLLVLAILRYAANAYDLGVVTNYTLVGAFCLLCGHFWNKNNMAPLMGIVLMLVTDIAINKFIYNGEYGLLSKGWWVIYSCFALIMYVGKIIPTYKSLKMVFASSVLSSIIFWLISDFQFFYFIGTDIHTQALLPRTLTGYMMALSQGAPFIKNFFVGTFAYSTVFFLLFKWSPVLFGVTKKQTSQSY